MSETLNSRQRLIKSILFRSNYRGGKEADLILGGFARQQAAHLEQEHLVQFAQLLTHDDSDIFAWLDDLKPHPSFLGQSLIQQINKYKETMRTS